MVHWTEASRRGAGRAAVRGRGRGRGRGREGCAVPGDHCGARGLGVGELEARAGRRARTRLNRMAARGAPPRPQVWAEAGVVLGGYDNRLSARNALRAPSRRRAPERRCRPGLSLPIPRPEPGAAGTGERSCSPRATSRSATITATRQPLASSPAIRRRRSSRSATTPTNAGRLRNTGTATPPRGGSSRIERGRRPETTTRRRRTRRATGTSSARAAAPTTSHCRTQLRYSGPLR
jgi:hypothetical protein